MYVLTVDQRGSRRDVDRVADLLDELRDAPMLRKFERTAGDEVQAVSDDPGTVVDLALALLDRNHWSIGIGIGPVETPLPPRPAPVASRVRARPNCRRARQERTRPYRCRRADTECASDVDAALTLLATIVLRRTDHGVEAVALARTGLSQAEIATRLAISKQAVSQRLLTAGWQAEFAGRALLHRLLERADR